MNSYLTSILIFTGINLISVLGMFLLMGLTGLLSFGQVGFMAIGAYVTAISYMRFGLPFGVGLLLGVGVSLLVGLLIGTVTLKLRNDYFALATYGFAEVIKNVLIYFSGYTGGSMGVFGIPAIVTLPMVAVIFVAALVLCRNFKVSKLGRNSLAIRNDELAAKVMGIDIFKHKLFVFLLSAVFGSIAGSLFAFSTYYIEPNMFNWSKSVELIVIVFFGGINSLTGVVFAGIALTLLPEILHFGAEWRMVIYTAIIIVTMIYRPTGLFGRWELSLPQILAAFKGRRRRAAGGGGQGA